MRQRALFDADAFPEGFRYRPEFLAAAAEAELLERISRLAFGEVRMRGVAAKRRTVQYGWHYSFESFRLSQAPPPPAYLEPLRERAAGFAGVPPAALPEILVTEYQPGAAIGWHGDAAPFGIVVGISLGSPCRFRFKRERDGTREAIAIELAPRSAYVLDGPARTDWLHSIPAVRALRYSITFRSLKRQTNSY
jgi:alkylated DNA repair dioxygenase AlkB